MADFPWMIQLIQASHGKMGSHYIPYSAGLLQAYVQHHASGSNSYVFLPCIFDRAPIPHALNQLRSAHVLGFSVYVWNENYSLTLAAAAKAARPEALIVFGGPQVPDQAEAYLRAHPFIDVAVHGEGERVFLQLLESLPNKDWQGIPGISWLDADGAFHHHPPGPRIKDLDEVPSPYLMGVFDELLSHSEIHWLIIWETTRGCPFSCTFCDWGSATAAKVNRFSLERIRAEVDWFAARGIKVIDLCDANFGILPRDLDVVDAIVAAHQRTGFPLSLVKQNTKNASERTLEIHRRLSAAGIDSRVTLSMQSLAPETLRSIRRDNISLAAYRELQTHFARAGVITYSDLLVGLPGETYDSFVDSVCGLISQGQYDWISFFNAFLLPNAEMSQPAYRQRYGIESVRVQYSELWLTPRQDIEEWQEMVVATASLSRADWRRCRIFAWWSIILVYNYKLIQLPLLVLHHLGGIPWRTLLERFSEGHFSGPVLNELRRFLDQRAQEVQQGGAIFCLAQDQHKSEWVTVENFVLDGLKSPAVTSAFFTEVAQVLTQLAQAEGALLPPGLLQESINLSWALFSSAAMRHPISLPGQYNLWEAYQAWRRQQPVTIRPQPCRYVRDNLKAPPFELRVEQAVSEPR